jgi:hypothetical protein
MSSTPVREQLRACRRYLCTLFDDAPEGSLVELRCKAERGMTCTYWPATDLDGVAVHVADRSPHTDVYVGVLPRRRRGGGRDDLGDEASVLWVDCDSSSSVRALTSFLPRPSLTVASGTGDNVHAYWLLRDAVPLDDIERANCSLAQLLEADRMCADAARILRPPSLNHKHAPPAPVRLLDCDPLRRWHLDEIVALAPVATDYSSSRTRSEHNDLLQLDPATYIEVLSGLVVGRDRKVACPFHDDSTPSLHAYRSGPRGWYCFGCGRGGSVYDFAAQLWGSATQGHDFVLLDQHLRQTFGLEARGGTNE